MEYCPLVEYDRDCDEQCPWNMDGSCAVTVIARALKK